jgi:hypothetical protein
MPSAYGIFNRDDEAETEVAVHFDYVPGAPPTGPSYASGGEPGYGPEVEFVAAFTVAGAEVELTDAEWQRIRTKIEENIDDYLPEPPERDMVEL